MDPTVKRPTPMRRTRSAAGPLAGLLLLPAFAAAGDPMRPPAPPPAVVATAPAGAPRPEPVASTEDAGAPGRLVSIRIDPADRPRALIGNQWVERGHTVGEWRVAEITADDVRLTRGTERRTLRLWPATRPVAAAATSTRAPRP